jgi:hypothetical protein
LGLASGALMRVSNAAVWTGESRSLTRGCGRRCCAPALRQAQGRAVAAQGDAASGCDPKKPRKANPKANKSQHRFGEKPSLVGEKVKPSQAKPMKANQSQGVLRFFAFRADGCAGTSAPTHRTSAACLRMLTNVHVC